MTQGEPRRFGILGKDVATVAESESRPALDECNRRIWYRRGWIEEWENSIWAIGQREYGRVKRKGRSLCAPACIYLRYFSLLLLLFL